MTTPAEVRTQLIDALRLDLVCPRPRHATQSSGTLNISAPKEK